MDDKKILSRTRLVIGEETDTKLSEMIGLSSGAVGNWSAGKPVNIKTILKYFEEHHNKINLHWLLTGEGEMYLKDVKDSVGGAGRKRDIHAQIGRHVADIAGLLEELQKEKK